jgi:RND family efflux transporter MFP subunit
MASRIWSLGGTLAAGILVAAGGYVYVNYWTFLNPPAVKTSTAFVAPVSEAVYGTGTVEPERWAKVVPLQRRRILELCLCEGQMVEAGQILAKQDDTEERDMLQELEIRREQLSRDVKRARDDRERNQITKAELEQRETGLEESQSRIAAQKARLDTLVLRAPLDGMVLRRDGEIGEIVGPTDVLFWVGPPLPKQVVAEISEEEITNVQIGQKAYLRTEAFPGQQLNAVVSQITPKGDPARKTFRTYLRLPNDSPLRIGMTVEVNIVFREKPSATLVPVEAVLNNAVQIVHDGKIEKEAVAVGIRGSRNVEVIGSVSAGAVVLSPGRTDLADGSWVKVTSTTRESAPVTAEPAPDPASNSPPGSVPAGSSSNSLAAPSIDPNDAKIASAITAQMDSVVSDARKNLYKFGGRP